MQLVSLQGANAGDQLRGAAHWEARPRGCGFHFYREAIFRSRGGVCISLELTPLRGAGSRLAEVMFSITSVGNLDTFRGWEAEGGEGVVCCLRVGELLCLTVSLNEL